MCWFSDLQEIFLPSAGRVLHLPVNVAGKTGFQALESAQAPNAVPRGQEGSSCCGPWNKDPDDVRVSGWSVPGLLVVI